MARHLPVRHLLLARYLLLARHLPGRHLYLLGRHLLLG